MGEVVGIDRGVKVSAALSTGEMLTIPHLSAREAARLRKLERKTAKARLKSPRDQPAQGLDREGQRGEATAPVGF